MTNYLEHTHVIDWAYWLSRPTTELPLTTTIFSTHKGGGSHTHNDIGRNTCEPIDYILTRRTHRLRILDAKINPQPPPLAKVDSDHNIMYAAVHI